MRRSHSYVFPYILHLHLYYTSIKVIKCVLLTIMSDPERFGKKTPITNKTSNLCWLFYIIVIMTFILYFSNLIYAFYIVRCFYYDPLVFITDIIIYFKISLWLFIAFYLYVLLLVSPVVPIVSLVKHIELHFMTWKVIYK